MSKIESERPTTEVFNAFALLAEHDGVAPINALPGCWERRVNANWTIAVNGQPEARESEPAGCMKVTLKPYHAAAWWNGWLAGIMTPFDGCIAAHPNGANELSLLAALNSALGYTEEC